MALMRKKNAYVPKTGLLGNGQDYNVYRPNAGERLLVTVAGAAAGFAAAYVFYESLILSIIAAVVLGAAAVPLWRKRQIRRQKDKLLSQFLSMLESLSTSLGAGSNVQFAFQSAADDMVVRYEADAYIVKELRIINDGIANNYNPEDLLMDLGERSGLPDIIDFANVFDTCFRKGGNIRDVIKNTYNVMNDRISIKLEINTAVSAQKMEQNAMLVMPVVFVFLLKQMGSDMVDLTSATGRISTTVAIVMFVLAYLASRKILNIKV